MRTYEEHALEMVRRMGPGEVQQLAVAAVVVLLAEDRSLSDLHHRAHVQGIIRGAAPTFHQALIGMISKARSIRVRQSIHHRHGA